MASTSSIASTLRRALLVKVISKPIPSREDVTAVIELTAAKVVEALQSQSMTLYLLEGNQIAFRHIYYSPSLWSTQPAKEMEFKANAAKLLELKLPLGQGIVGKVIADGKPIFFRNTQTQAPMMLSMAQTTGFEVFSMLTVPLQVGSLTIGALQVLNKEPISGTQGIFSESDVGLLQEVAEYSAALIQRMLDPKFQPSPDDTAKFIARLTDHPLITKVEELTIDENLVTAIVDAIIRREQVFPCSRTSANSIGVLMTNPLDYARREAFQQATELVIDEISIASAPFIEALVKNISKTTPPPLPPT